MSNYTDLGWDIDSEYGLQDFYVIVGSHENRDEDGSIPVTLVSGDPKVGDVTHYLDLRYSNGAGETPLDDEGTVRYFIRDEYGIVLGEMTHDGTLPVVDVSRIRDQRARLALAH